MVLIIRKLPKGRPNCHIRSCFSICERYNLLVLRQVYASLLAAIPIFITGWRTSLVRHNIFVLLTVLAVYSYRDVWPLANYGKTPMDVEEGKLLWGKLAILMITAVLIPLFIPREYNPTDPEVRTYSLTLVVTPPRSSSQGSMEEPSSEQTCCLMSMMLYSFVDPIIVVAAKFPHLSYNELPPQPYYDQSKHLIKHAFRVGRVVFNGTFLNLISFLSMSTTMPVQSDAISRWVCCVYSV